MKLRHIDPESILGPLYYLLGSFYYLTKIVPKLTRLWNSLPGETKLLVSIFVMGGLSVSPMAILSTLYIWRIVNFPHSTFNALFLGSLLFIGPYAWAYLKLKQRFNVQPKLRHLFS